MGLSTAAEGLDKAQWRALSFGGQRMIAHDCPSTDDGGHGPARRFHTVERRPAATRGDPGIFDAPLFLEIDDSEIGVEAARDAALAGDTENARRACARQIDETLQRHPSRVDMV